MILISSQITLRAFDLSDAKRVAELAGDAEIARWTANIPHPYHESDAQQWIQRMAADVERFPFAVESDGVLVGCVSFWPYRDQCVEVGYWIGRNYWGNGIASKALRIMLAEKLPGDITHVVAKTMAGNIGSQSVLIKCGFRFESECDVIKKGEHVPGHFYSRLCDS